MINIQSTENKVISRIYRKNRGWVFTPINFVDLGSQSAVSKALERLVNRGTIRRLTRGLYDYPEHHSKLGLIPPNYNMIGKAIELKNNIKLQPSGAYAANLLGLSEQVPAKIIFLTDGASRVLKVGNQRITFKATTPKNMATAGRVSGLVIQALRYLGKDHVNDKIIRKLQGRLNQDDIQQLIRDIRYAPEWIRQIFKKLNNGKSSAVG